MHRASNISNLGQGTITIIITNRGGYSNRKKGHSRLLYSIRISLVAGTFKMLNYLHKVLDMKMRQYPSENKNLLFLHWFYK